MSKKEHENKTINRIEGHEVQTVFDSDKSLQSDKIREFVEKSKTIQFAKLDNPADGNVYDPSRSEILHNPESKIYSKSYEVNQEDLKNCGNPKKLAGGGCK